MTGPERKPRILHIHPSFVEKGTNAARMMSALGTGCDHALATCGEGRGEVSLAGGVHAHVRTDFPALAGKPTPGRLVAIAQAMAPYDLVLTHDWDAMNAVMAHTVFAQALGLPPLIHHEGFVGREGSGNSSTRRNWFRRVALGRTHALVVPSRAMEQVALNVWKLPRSRVRRVPPGIDTSAFAGKPDPKALRLVKRKGERWVGTVADLQPGERLPDIVKACAKLPDNWHLVILGEGPERDTIADAADALEVSDRVHLPGPIADHARVIGLFDIFACASLSEAVPVTIIEAMAAGLPVVAPRTGDIEAVVAQPNRSALTVPGDVASLAEALAVLVRDTEWRRDIGIANRDLARAEFDEAHMTAACREIYEGALANGA